MSQWKGFSLEDFHEVLEGLLYIIIALIIGSLVEKERRKHMALVEAERLASIGKAVSEVAHDMKTPLMVIGGFATLVSQKLNPEDPNQKRLGVVMQETERLESMIRQMLDFGHPLELQTLKTSLNDLVIETTETAQPLSRNTAVDLRVDLEPSLPPLDLDSPRIKQVLLNLITNAVEASPAGKCVLIRTVLAPHGVMLEVVDHGLGITEEHRQRVFDPFFSTKKGGTGLGLGIVKKIVEAHGGSVSFQSSPEKGATFRLRFPR
jgi:signal transduction histidine kinase